MKKGPSNDGRGLRLIGYVRVSTEDQAVRGVSLEAQRERLSAFAVAHGTHSLLRIEGDEGISGSVPPARRPGLSRALAAIRSREADGLLFLKLDRLSRSARDILELASEAKRERWHILSVQDSIDTSGGVVGAFILQVLAAISELELGQTRARTTAALAQIARQGRGRSRFIPFGYRVDGAEGETVLRAGERRLLREHEPEMALLRDIIDMRERGLGARRIANTLNGKGSNPRTGRPWNSGTVAAILRTVDRRANALAGRA